MTSELRKSEHRVLKAALVALEAWEKYGRAKRNWRTDRGEADRAFSEYERTGKVHIRLVKAYRKAIRAARGGV